MVPFNLMLFLSHNGVMPEDDYQVPACLSSTPNWCFRVLEVTDWDLAAPTGRLLSPEQLLC